MTPTAPLVGTAAGTELIWFVGFVLLAVLSAWMAFVARRIAGAAPESQSSLWGYYTFVGLAGLLVGAVGAGRVSLSAPPTAVAALVPTLLLGYAFGCALSMREAQYNAVFSNTELERFGDYPTRRGAEVGIVVGILGVGLPPLVIGPSLSAALTILLAPGIVVYGGYFFREHLRGTATQGTLVDTLVRHVLLTLVFVSAAAVSTALLLVSPETAVLDSLGATFLLLGTASLIAVVIKFRQHAVSV
ncbi:hypothetical protein [Halobaculum sp. MBLA0143]|uniref:hypothetical protein n=1 Tax=Halobaculum sp. MBLA0143 TaxID=3079933 RepID=UPI0035242994